MGLFGFGGHKHKTRLGANPSDAFEKRRRRQRGICLMCGNQLVRIAVNKSICPNCGFIGRDF